MGYSRAELIIWNLFTGSLLLGFLVVIAWCAAVDDGRRVTDPHCETQETPTP